MIESFVYDGVDLKESGFSIVSFDGITNGGITTDSQRSFNQTSLFAGKYHPFLTTTYDTPLIMKFQIMALPCPNGSFRTDNFEITLERMRWLKTWLSQSKPCRLTIPNSEYEGIVWEGSFNVEEIVMGSKRIGAELTFTSNRPFGFTEVNGYASVSANGTISLNNTSDEYGYIYPDLSVTLLGSGDLEITNSFDSRETVVENCVSGEVITFDHLLIISSSVSSHDVSSDFNYVFQRLNRDNESGTNILTFNLPCQVTYSFRLIRKVVVA